MKYIYVKWNHNFHDEPIAFYVELDDMMFQTRMLEIYQSGKIAFATRNMNYGDTFLIDEPYPSIEEINSDNDREFMAVNITEREFKEIWNTSLEREGFEN